MRMPTRVRVSLLTRPSHVVRWRLRLLFNERSGRNGVVWGSWDCGRRVGGHRNGLLGRCPIDDGPSNWGGRCFVPDGCASTIIGWGGVVAC